MIDHVLAQLGVRAGALRPRALDGLFAFRGLGLAIATVAFGASLQVAEAAYDCRLLTMVVPFPAGSSTDTIARALGEKASASLAIPVVVENKPGAEGQIAAVDIMRAPPDGCRLHLATSGNLSIVPYIRKEPPYDPRTDFTAVAGVGRYTYILYVASDVGAATLADFVAEAKRRPGALNYATGSNTNLLAMAYIQSALGIHLTRVSYRGEPPAILDMIGGRIQAMVATTIGLPHAKEGKLKAFAVMLPKRMDAMPDLPTFDEVGIRGLSIVPWAGLVGPAGIPAETVATLNKVFVSAMQDADVRRKMDDLGFVLMPSSPEAFAKEIADQHVVYGQRIREAGLEPQ